jgi:hypothetical protein
MMRSALGGERKVVGPGDAQGRPPIIKCLLVGCEVHVGQGGGRQIQGGEVVVLGRWLRAVGG